MKALDRKVLRNLAQMRGQVVAIGLVMACGVATFVMSLSLLRSLEGALDAYYARYRFAHVFAHVERAPRAWLPRLEAIPGVGPVQARVVEHVTLDMPGLAEPAVGRLISLPEHGPPRLNDLHLRRGRRLEPGRDREVLVGEAFADAHGLLPGARIRAVMNGRVEELEVVGIVLSPEYIYQIRDGDLLPDDRRFGVMWMNATALEAAFDMKGAFNDLTLELVPGASEPEVLRRVDRILDPAGSLGAYGRADHTSHKFIENEITELRTSTVVIPIVFLGVAAFLLNVVMSRLVSTQREQVAMLKAVGYSALEIGVHYLEIVLVIVVLGVVVGVAAGAWMGSGLMTMYANFFHFPVFRYRLEADVVVLAMVVTGGASVAGTIGALGRAMRLPPAEAMRPEPPSVFRRSLVETLGLARLLSPAARMVFRQIERRPLRSALSCLGIALAVSILVVGSFMEDAIDHVMVLEFEMAQRQDLMVTLTSAASPAVLHAIERLPGVRRCEPFRAVGVRLRAGHRHRRVGIMGLAPDGDLFRLIDMHERRVSLPPRGLVMSEKLAELLDVEVGDDVTIEVLESFRPVRTARVEGLIADFAGTAAYMSIDALNELMRQEDVVSGAYVAADPDRIDALFHELKATPNVAGVMVKEATIQSFYDTLAESMLKMKAFNVMFAVIIAFGVVYNGARISLAERSRDLATLRVIGFTRAEISLVQLGELATLTVIALPGGLFLGYGLAWMTSQAVDSELFRIPLVVSRSTYAFAASVVLVATVLSGLVVRRTLDRLDLVSVLKTRE